MEVGILSSGAFSLGWVERAVDWSLKPGARRMIDSDARLHQHLACWPVVRTAEPALPKLRCASLHACLATQSVSILQPSTDMSLCHGPGIAIEQP